MNLFHLSLRGTKQSKLFAHQQSEGFPNTYPLPLREEEN
jgi:hypothetical protein